MTEESVHFDTLRQQVSDFIAKISENDAQTLAHWRQKNKEKIDLVIKRRLVRLEIILESRIGETILEIRSQDDTLRSQEFEEQRTEALRRATDQTPLLNVMKDEMSDFEKSSQENIKQIIENCNDQDRMLRLMFFTEDRQIFSQPRNKWPDLIRIRDDKRSEEVKLLMESRAECFREIFEKSSNVNLDLLRNVDDIGIDMFDDLSLNSRTLEDYCFDT